MLIDLRAALIEAHVCQRENLVMKADSIGGRILGDTYQKRNLDLRFPNYKEDRSLKDEKQKVNLY